MNTRFEIIKDSNSHYIPIGTIINLNFDISGKSYVIVDGKYSRYGNGTVSVHLKDVRILPSTIKLSYKILNLKPNERNNKSNVIDIGRGYFYDNNDIFEEFERGMAEVEELEVEQLMEIQLEPQDERPEEPLDI
jgi:hypothetical protein